MLEFSGEPATDQDGDELTYRFAVALFDRTGLQTPEEALLRIIRTDQNRFEILPDGDVSPAEFTAVYGDQANIPGLQSAIYASDGISESTSEVYSVDIVYDASAQYSAPAEYVGDQRWVYPEPIDWYEGTSEPVGGAFPTWTGVTAGNREWRLDRSPATIRCEIATIFDLYSFEDGGEDNNLFNVASGTRATSGTVRLSFKTSPDFEIPGDENGDNIYHLRVVNTHDINNIDQEGTPSGCSGSLLDLAIRVRDVGVPDSPGILSASFSGTPETGETMLKVYWTASGGFVDNGTVMPFPTGFEETSYDYRYRAVGTSVWTEESESIMTQEPFAIEGLTGEAYEVQVRTNNREGKGTWSEKVEADRFKHTAYFGASLYSAVEGNADRAVIEVHLDPPPILNPITVPLAVTHGNGVRQEDYSSIPPGLTFQPHETVKSFTLTSYSETHQHERVGESIRLTFVELPSNVTIGSPATAKVILGDGPPDPRILGMRFSSIPGHGSYYGFMEIIEVEVTYDQPVEVWGSPYLWLKLNFPGRRKARYSHGTGTVKLYFQYCVIRRDRDGDGVGIVEGIFSLVQGSINSVSTGTAANLNHDGLPDDPNHRVNGRLMSMAD